MDKAGREGAGNRPPTASSRMRTTQVVLGLFILVVLALAGRDLFLGGPDPTIYHTAAGEYTEFTLPDGSEVKLNVESRVVVPPTFGTGRRIVQLEGEGLFDVSFDPRQPFVVESNGMTVTAVGTLFNVEAYPEDVTWAVVLSEGAIEVTTGEMSVSPRLGQRALLTGDSLYAEDTNVSDALAWQEGRLVFSSTPLDIAARRMERWYGVSVVIADPEVRPLRIDAEFEHDSAAEAANVIAAMLGIDAIVTEAGITFRSRGEE